MGCHLLNGARPLASTATPITLKWGFSLHKNGARFFLLFSDPCQLWFAGFPLIIGKQPNTPASTYEVCRLCADEKNNSCRVKSKNVT